MASGTTPVKSWPYPLETDTPDVAADLHALALALDVTPKSTQGTLAARPVTGMSAGDRHVVEGDATAANNGVEWYYTGSVWTAISVPRIPARAYRTAALAFGGTSVKVPIDTVSLDDAGGFDVTTNHRYNVPTTGKYRVSAQLEISSSTGMAYLQVRKNGTTTLTEGSGYFVPSGTAATHSTVSDVFDLTAGDYLELWGIDGASGASLNISGVVAAHNFLAIDRLTIS